MRIGAVILAAGFGTRLAPLTDHTPKPLLDVGGQPVATHLVERLQAVEGLDHVVVVVNDRHLDQWRRWADQLASSAPPEITVVSNGVIAEADRVGAVADLAAGIDKLQSHDDTGPADWVIVLAGDNLIEEQLSPHLDAAIERQRPVVLCRDLGDEVPPGRFGEITIDADGLVTRFREKPARPESPYAATCTYVFPRGVDRQLVDYLRDGDADSPGSFVAWLAARTPVIARPLTGRYFDIGNHETLAAARRGR